MPSNLLNADINFPNLQGKTTDQKFGTITDYLYMLLEQLRYSMANLGVSNFNEAEIENLANIITEPVYIQLKDQEGNLLSLTAEVDNVTSRVTDVEGNVSTLQQTSSSMMSSITNLEGDVSTLQQTAGSLQSQITDAEGNISTLQQNVNGLSSRVTAAEGNVSSITQTVNSISLGVSNGSSGSTITLYKNGIAASSQYIQFTGMVTFSDLSTEGQTSINGGNISAGGTIEGVTLKSLSGLDSGFEVCYGNKYSSILVGGMRYDEGGAGTGEEAKYRMFIYTEQNWAMKLQSGASMSITADGELYISAETGIVIDAKTYGIQLRGASLTFNGTAIA